MRIQYFGTAAAEGVPAMFCDCAICRNAREKGGKEIRTRSQALVDGRLLIDFPADTYMHMLYGGLPLPQITSCLLTHSHSDHCYPADLEMRSVGMAPVLPQGAQGPLTVYGSPKALEKMQKIVPSYGLDKQGRVSLCPVKPFAPFTVEGYTVTALPAHHSPVTGPQFYIIAGPDKTMLYAHDTGYFPEETWEYLQKEKPCFDFVSLDCNYMDMGYMPDYHMSFEVNLAVRDRLYELGCAHDKTVWCAHHFSHNSLLTHEQMEARAAKDGFLASYDGMIVDF